MQRKKIKTWSILRAGECKDGTTRLPRSRQGNRVSLGERQLDGHENQEITSWDPRCWHKTQTLNVDDQIKGEGRSGEEGEGENIHLPRENYRSFAAASLRIQWKEKSARLNGQDNTNVR